MGDGVTLSRASLLILALLLDLSAKRVLGMKLYNNYLLFNLIMGFWIKINAKKKEIIKWQSQRRMRKIWIILISALC